jgi:ribonuclease P protein component
VAFALGRAFGPAVVRNRVRRRLRAMLLAASSAGTLPAGEFLIGARPDAALRSSIELEFDLAALLRRLQS